MFQNTHFFDNNILNEPAATLQENDSEAAKATIKEWVAKYANDEHYGNLSKSINESENEMDENKLDIKHVDSWICKNCGVMETNALEWESENDTKSDFGLAYCDTVKIEMNTFQCQYCWFLLPKICNAKDANSRNDDIHKIIKSLPLPHDIVMIILKYWLDTYRQYILWAVKIKSVDLSQLSNNKLLIELCQSQYGNIVE